MKRKVICLVLCVVMMFSLSAEAFAMELSSAAMQRKYSLTTEFDSIKKSAAGEYAMVTDTNKLLPVGRLDVDLRDSGEVTAVAELSILSPEVKEYVKDLAERVARDSISEQPVATIFSADLLSTRTSYRYTTYNGMEMKSDLVYAENIGSSYSLVREGTTAKSYASAAYEIALLIGGLRNGAVSLGGTLLSLFENYYNTNVVSVSADDYTQVEVFSDFVSQWTYGKADGVNWTLGYCSQDVTITRVAIHQQFVVNGTGRQHDETLYLNRNIKSPYFDSPWEMAYLCLGNPAEDWVSCKLYGKTYYF